MPNVKLTLAYDGTHYLGWQTTNAGSSIQSTLQMALETILSEKVSLQAASRTDAGVHAEGQIVNFLLSKENVCLKRLKTSLNGLLPPDIAVLKLEVAADNFHPTIDCIRKEYHYLLSHAPIQSPTRRFYCWHYPRQLDVTAMRSAAQHFIGEHDFSAFCNLRKILCYDHHIRHLQSIDIDELSDNQLRFRIIGNNFLYKMVRTLVGTLVDVGSGKIPVQEVQKILKSHDRTKAGLTAPACGLSLHKIYY